MSTHTVCALCGVRVAYIGSHVLWSHATTRNSAGIAAVDVLKVERAIRLTSKRGNPR